MSNQNLNPTIFSITQKNDWIKCLILSIVCVVLIVTQRVYHWHLPEQVFRLPFQQITKLPNTTYDWFKTVRNNLKSKQNLLEKLAYIEEQNLLLATRVNELFALEKENLKLKNLLEVRSSIIDFDAKVAEVLFVANRDILQLFTINLGKTDGTKVGQAVMDEKGVIGQIVKIDLFTSQVVLITDPSVSIPVYNARSGSRNFTNGNGHNLLISSIDKFFLIEKGDILLTSGRGDTFPRGFPVGIAQSVSKEQRYIVQSTIKPLANLESINRVVVLVGKSVVVKNNPTSNKEKAK